MFVLIITIRLGKNIVIVCNGGIAQWIERNATNVGQLEVRVLLSPPFKKDRYETISFNRNTNYS